MSALAEFEKIARNARNVGSEATTEKAQGVHPFDQRNIHPEITSVSLALFDDGHFAQATFEAYKLVETIVKKLSGVEDTGFSLMMTAFNEAGPRIRLTDMATMSDKDEQKGYRHIFAGTSAGIRNPRGHDNRADSIDLCLDHLSLASALLRTIDARKAP